MDTNVLIPFHTEDFFIELGKRGLPVRWSRSIEAEFLDVWARLFPDRTQDGAKILRLMRQAVPDWHAPESRGVIKEAVLPDPQDRHVLAAAVGAGADIIVTNNLKDFPATILAHYGVTARTPDEVLCALFDENPEAVIAAASTMRARLKNPAMAPDVWLESIGQGGCKQLARRLKGVSDRL